MVAQFFIANFVLFLFAGLCFCKKISALFLDLDQNISNLHMDFQNPKAFFNSKDLAMNQKGFCFQFHFLHFFSRHQLSFNKKRNHFIRNKKKCKEIFRHRKTCYYCCLTAKVCIIYYVSLKIPSNSNRAKVFSKK